MTTVRIQEDYKGFRIDYIFPPYSFQAYKGSKEYASDKTLPELLKKLDTYTKHQRRFKKLQVIDIDDDKVVEITSRDIEMPDRCVWVTDRTETGQPNHGKQYLQQHNWNRDDRDGFTFALATPDNLRILADIQTLQAQRETVNKTILALRRNYAEPITPEFLNKLDEEKESKKGGMKDDTGK